MPERPTDSLPDLSSVLNIRYPIIQGGMIWVSGWRLAAAVSNAGGLGQLGAGSMPPKLLEQHIRKFKEVCPASFAVNIPVSSRYAKQHVDICIENHVPVVTASAGSPGKYTEHLKSSGVKVLHVVPTTRLALKAERAGCDAVVAEGTEAGGHNGFDQITSLTLWPSVVESVNIPVVAAGGIVDGRGMAAAFALGARAVQLGTAFAVTKESSADQRYKTAVVEASETDTRLYLQTAMPTRTLCNSYVEKLIAAERSGTDSETLIEMRGRGRARMGIFEGDTEKGEMEIGQGAGRIRQNVLASQVIRSLMTQFVSAVDELHRISGLICKNATETSV